MSLNHWGVFLNFFLGIRLKMNTKRSLSTSKMAALCGWSPILSSRFLRCDAAGPWFRFTHGTTHLRSSPAPHILAASATRVVSIHQTKMSAPAGCRRVCVVAKCIDWLLMPREDNGGRDAVRDRHISPQCFMRNTDQVRASPGCRTSPAPTARGPRNSPRWCRCGWWSGTAATPTPAPSAAPHNGDTRRRSHHRYRLRWPGRPPRPQIKLTGISISFCRTLFSL